MRHETVVSASIKFSLEEYAKTVLTDSLKSVRRWLKRAAREWADDDEIVHCLRVFSRRALSALNLFENLIPKSEGRWFRKRLKAILRAAGRARDLDVLIETQLPQCGKSQRTLAKQWRAERAAAQKPIAALHRKVNQNDRFREHLRSLVANLKNADAKTGHDARLACDERIRPKLAELCNRVVNALEMEADERSLHELRIAVKRLRYAVELLLPVVMSQQMHELNEALPELQKQLGVMQDHVVARQALKRSIGYLKKQSQQKRLQARIRDETCRIADSVAAFRSWSNSDACRELKECLETIV